MEKKQDTFSYKGWLISDNFIKRSFASLGYHMMAVLFIWVGFFAIGMVFAVIALIINLISRLF